MDNINIWTILTGVAVILLLIYWRMRNAVWGGLTAGIVVGLVILLLSDFNGYIIVKSAALGTIIGFCAELLGRVSDKIKNSE